MCHLMTCQEYGGESHVENWKDIYINDPDSQYEIALKIRKRLYLRETYIQEAGLDSDPGSQAPDGSVVAL